MMKTRTLKFVAGFVGVAMALSFVAPVVASAQSSADIQTQINSLLATIQSLQAQLGTTGGTTMSTGYTFNTNLTTGSKGVDVMNLQKVLNMSADTKVASTGAGSPGMETSTFGGLTKAAVMKFQTKYGITPVAGYVGAITRAKLNSMSTGTTGTGTTTGTLPAGCTSTVGFSSTTGASCGTGSTTLPTGGSLMVSAATQPMNSLAPQGASRVPFTTFTLTAGSSDVSVTSVTVQRSGLAQDAVFAGIVLLDQNGMQIGIAKTLNSNHQATVGDPFIVRAGTSMTYTVAGNMASALGNYAGQVASLSVVAINTTASVQGALPISGAQQTINASLVLGSATVNSSSFDPAGGSSQPIGTTGFRFAGLKVTAGSAEDLTLKSIRWNQTGSVGSSDLGNVMTVVNGTSYPTTVSTDGKYFSTVFPSGIVITKGNSVDVYIQGDVVGSGAAGRTAEFDIYKNTDLYLMGNTYGYGVTAPTGAGVVLTALNHTTVLNTSSNPWFEGSNISVTAGSVTLIGKANEVTSQNIASNVPNQVLGGFATNFSGEKVSAQTMTFTLSTTSGTTGGLVTSVSLVDQNGAVVAGPVDATTANGGTTQTITFTDTVTFPIGRAVYTLKGKIPSGASNGTTLSVATTPSTWGNVTGQTTGNNIDLSQQNASIALNTMTVKGALLTINVSAQPASQNIVGGVQQFVLDNYQLDATQSGEDVRLSSFPVKVDATPVTTGVAITDLTGCQLWNGTTALNTGSRVINGSALLDSTAKTFSFDNTLTVPKGTSVTLSLACNISSAPAATAYQTLADATTGDYSVTGVTSGNTVIPTFGAGNGGLMTVGSGSFTIAADSSTPNYTTVAAGSTGVTDAVFKFRATNENINLTKVGLTLTSGTASDIGTVYLYQGSTLIGTAVFPQGANAVATSSLISPLTLQANVDTLITVKTDLGAIGVGQSGGQGDQVKIDVTNAEGSGLSSGLTLKTGGVVAGALGLRMFKSFPTVAQDVTTLSGTGVADGKLMRFKITADSHGPVGIESLNFTVATSGAASTNTLVSSGILRVFTDASYSQAAGGNFGASTGQFGATAGAAGLPNSPTAINFITTSNNPLQIPAGTTYYFELDATVAGVTTGSSVTTKLLGDSAYWAESVGGVVNVSTTTNALADANHSFIWSGNATGTAVSSSNDWANGYGILGLPAAGFTTTRSN